MMVTTTPASAPLRVMIIGCGVIGKHHSRVLTRHPEFRVVALVDPLAEATEAAATIVTDAGGESPRTFDSIEAAVAAGDIDVATICTPSGMHVEHAEACLAHDLHVVIEKPLDAQLAAGRRLAPVEEEARRAGLVVSVISQHRFDPANAVVRKAIADDRFGSITSAMASMPWFRSQAYYDMGDWRGTWAMDGGGAVMNQGVHTVDLLRWFLGRPVEIFAHTAQLAHERIEIEDTATATVRFESGALAVIHATTAGYPGLGTRITVHGTDGSAVIEGDKLEYFFAREKDAAQSQDAYGAKVENQAADQVPAHQLRGGEPPTDGVVDGHARQYDDIAAAIAEKREAGVTVNEALLSIALIRALYVSATLGQPVLFDDILAGKHDDVEPRVGGSA